MKQFFKHPTVITVAKVIISAALLSGLIYYIDVEAVLVSLSNANIIYLSAGLALAIIQVIIHLYRWRYLLHLISKDITHREAYTSFFVGFMAGFFTPAQLGEFAGRIASHPTVNKSHIVGITLIDKIYWAALTFVIGGTGLVVFIADYYPEYWNPLYRYAVTFVLGIIIVIFLYPEKIKELLQLLPEKVRRHRFYEIIQVIENEFHNRNAWMFFSITGLLYGVILLEYYFLVNAFGTVAFGDAMMCAASVFFVKAVILPISFGDLGIRESAAVFFFEGTGTAAAVAFNASIVMSLANVIIPTAIGALLVTSVKRQ
ncbi:MAG: flippase-like domain-containing protein [Bacteroidetes bacterium]|nr:flippase-like domain-containing protein [Bacteroidota bacterium]